LKITNKHNVPETLVALASRDYYSKGRADYSVTEIISPPRIQRLRRQHHENMEQDVSDMLWQLLGSALHVVAERGAADNHITEERIIADIGDVKLSGAIDIQKVTPEGIIITDYKFTSAWALRQDKPEWEAQQNIYAWLVEKVKGKKVIGVQICALIRDWSRREASVKADYPQAPIQVLELPLWPLEKTEAYIKERIDAHRLSKVQADWGDELPPCSDDDRWVRETKFAVKREGRKTAIRVFDTEQEAKDLAEKEKGYVEVRKGEAIRCTGNFCGVAQWCSQYQQSLKEANDE
jgi:PD-(D/E)XK nuclease superfamily